MTDDQPSGTARRRRASARPDVDGRGDLAPEELGEPLRATPEDGGTVVADAVEIRMGAVGQAQADRIDVATGAIGGVRAETVTVERGAVGGVLASSVSISQGMASTVVAKDVRLDQVAARSVVAQTITVEGEAATFFLVAQNVSGNVRVLFDWRGALAFGLAVGLVSGLVRRSRDARD
jgi:hypothetical protein